MNSLGIADLSASVLLQLRRKHPERDRPVPHDLPVQVPAVRVSLTETFRKLRRRAGTGPSGNRNEYLRVLTHSFDDAKADSVMQKYDAFASELASGDLPTWFYGAASIASLMPLVKKAVTQADVEAMRQPDVRPVAVGEVTLRSILTSVTASVAPAMADVLAPQQVAVGVSGGISIMINGIRILLEQRGDFVLVKIDLKNAYNEIDRSALLRRCSEVPELAPFMPLLHATLMSATSLLVGPQRTRLFEQHHLEGQTCRAETSRGGDSATGTQQGGPPSSGAFCIAIQPELAALDAELRPFGGGAWAEMDDIFALGPAAAVFPAVKRFGEAVKASLNLEMQVSKLECFSPEYNLSHCPWREALGAPVGMVLVPEEDGGSRTYRGVMVAGCPMGEAGFVDAWLRAQVSSIVSYIDKTVLSLRAASPHALWAAIYYSCSAKFDFILRHLPPDKTVSHARVVDAALTRAAEACGYEGVLGDAITARRARLPARMRGLGLRSLEEVAPAAFCACFVEAAERFLDRSTPGGGRERGFFQMLAPLFGHGAFELPYPNSPRLSRFLSGCTTNVNPLGAQLGQLTPTGESFKTAWEGMQREVRGEGVAGPLDLRAPEAGNGRAGSAGLQRQLTQQREQVKRNQLSRSILGLPHGDTRREAWLAVDSFSSAWVSSWPSAQNRCEAREFREIFCTYLGRESPAVRALVGKSIACSGRGPPRVCDAFGVQLGLATLNDRAHGNCHDDIFSRVIGDALHAGLRGKEEPREIFSAVIPPVTLNGTAGTRGKNGIVPDGRLHCKLRESRTARCTGTRGQAHPSVRWRGTTVQRGPEQPQAEHLLEGKTIHRGGPHYMSARARDDGQGGAVADRANLVQRDYEARAAALDAKPHVQAWNNGSRDAVSSVLRSFGTVRSLVVGAYAEASDDLHQLFDCVVESASKQHWRRIGARSAKEARSYFATTLRRAWGVHFAREFARHRIRRVVFVGAPRRQPGRPLATADGDWPALSAGEFAAHALRVGGAWAGGPPGRR